MIAKKVGEATTFESVRDAIDWFCRNFSLVPKSYRLHEVRIPILSSYDGEDISGETTGLFKMFYVWAQNQGQAAGYVLSYLRSSPSKVRFEITDPNTLELVRSLPPAIQRRLNIVENGKEVRKLRQF